MPKEICLHNGGNFVMLKPGVFLAKGYLTVADSIEDAYSDYVDVAPPT